ncbi:MgtC/SapB family protein [Porphyromonas pogonae]|uniref:MgtC/SapB family protein n=1 Tax=Porphyromonas pogonae TaxID=867595 RepID=UPI002E762DE5|nr:MgtC/SapB family protein [Porphyromonas pogonae]
MITGPITLYICIERILLSLVIGGLIGLERQLKFRSAGLRTFTLICIGSTMATLVSIWAPWSSGEQQMHGDPARIAAQVLSGIGFIGAGAIIQTKASVQGLTTAASIWVSAVIGLAIGIGLYIPSVTMGVIVILVLNVDEQIEKRTIWGGKNRYLEIQLIETYPEFETQLKIIFKDLKIKIISTSVVIDKSNVKKTYVFNIRTHNDDVNGKLIERLNDFHAVSKIKLMN